MRAVTDAAWTAAAADDVMAAAFCPLVFFARLYYPVQLLPGVMQDMSHFTPFGAAVRAMQASMDVRLPAQLRIPCHLTSGKCHPAARQADRGQRT